jgi:hypothetical protein
MYRMAFIEHSNMAIADSANQMALAADNNMYVLLILVAPRILQSAPFGRCKRHYYSISKQALQATVDHHLKLDISHAGH